MKKLLAIVSCAVMLLSLAACGENDSDTPQNPVDDNQVVDNVQDDAANNQDDVVPNETEEVSPLELLNNVWNNYAEDDKFSAVGGETMNGPGEMTGDFSSAEAIENMLLLPASDFEKVSNPASLMHMMNANTFTCGAYTVLNTEDIAAIAADIKEKITTNQWMCGFPDKMFVASYGNCILSAFGNAEVIDTFKENLKAVYPEVDMIYEEDIVL